MDILDFKENYLRLIEAPKKSFVSSVRCICTHRPPDILPSLYKVISVLKNTLQQGGGGLKVSYYIIQRILLNVFNFTRCVKVSNLQTLLNIVFT